MHERFHSAEWLNSFFLIEAMSLPTHYRITFKCQRNLGVGKNWGRYPPKNDDIIYEQPLIQTRTFMDVSKLTKKKD